MDILLIAISEPFIGLAVFGLIACITETFF